MSKPTIAATPASPTRSPAQRPPPWRSRSPVKVVTTAPTRGTPAIRSPVRELVSLVSAFARSSQGSEISIAVKTRSAGQWRRSIRSSRLHAAIGSSSADAITVIATTSVTGLRSRTATRISRYGIPQITHIAANSSAPRRVIDPPLAGAGPSADALDDDLGDAGVRREAEAHPHDLGAVGRLD